MVQDVEITVEPPARRRPGSAAAETAVASPRWQYGLGDLLMVVASASLYLAAFQSLVVDDFVAVAAGVGGGLACGGFCVLVFWAQARSYKKAATIRLPRRWNRKLWLVGALVVPGVVIVASSLSTPWRLQKDFSGLSLGALLGGAVFTCWYLVPARIHVGEEGVVLDGLAYVPWKRLRVKRLCGIPPALKFQAGWMDLWMSSAAIVPPEQHEAAEAVLKERLPAARLL